MFSGEYLFNIIGLGALISAAGLGISLVLQLHKNKQISADIEELRKSLDEMDEQAKLVVRTDMELNKTQEELDKKVAGLYALQRLSRTITTTLEESQIFATIKDSCIEELGFEKCSGYLWSEKENKFIPHINLGYSPDEIEVIKSMVNSDKAFYIDLVKKLKTISSIFLPENIMLKERINKVFDVNYFIISTIAPKEGEKGFLFVGTKNNDRLITEGDEELINILTTQLGQALENARLFEKTWKAHQELENRVEQRTRELTKALEEVKRISKRKNDFVSSVAHELRTPLTSIKGYASILLTEKLGAIPEEAKLRIEKINRHSDELAYFVNDLLDISRIESGKMLMKLEPLDLNKIFEETAELLSIQLKEKNIELSSAFDTNALAIFADSNQIKRIFINIISNAIKFTPAGGKITVRSRETSEQKVQIDISDTGCGIPEEAKDAIFEEFYRVDNSINQEVKGTGLGLALVKNIIEAHKGKIWVTSKSGAGSIFSFTLPKGK